MPGTVIVDSLQGIIQIESEKTASYQDLLQQLKSLKLLAAEHNLKKVLHNATSLEYLPSVMQIHNFAAELARQTPGMMHAIIVSTQTPKDINFIQTVAHNRGASVRVFLSRDDALSWLHR
jgi:hypothetical protein